MNKVNEEKLMSAKERLHTVQTALAEQGAVDVKFYLAANSDVSLTEVAEGVASFLEAAVIENRAIPADERGDSTHKHKP